MLSGVLLLLVIAGILVLTSRNEKQEKMNHPPSSGIPPIITMLQLFLHPHPGRLCTEIGRAYGAITYTKLGPFKGILLNGSDVVREACRLKSLNGRIDCMYKDIMGHQGLLWTDDTSQKRKVLFRSSKHFGLGIAAEEAVTHEEITQLFKYFDSYGGKAFSVKGAFNIPTINGVAHRLLGEKVPQNDTNLLSVVERLNVVSEVPGLLLKACVFAPALTRWIPWSISGRKFIEKVFMDGMTILAPLLEKHFKSRVVNQPRDVADALMDEVESTKDVHSVFHFSKDPIRPIIFDMLSAAIETTGAMLEWIILYLSQFPKVQTRLQNELDLVIGMERIPELHDRPTLLYLQAFIQEMFRVTPVIPFWFHMALEDTNFRGYTIEKGTYIIGNFFGCHMDPDVWKDPDEFKPERFIGPNGEFLKSDQLFTFGSGKRSCVGEATARDQLFLYVARIVQSYHVRSHSNLKSLDGKVALGYHAPAFKVELVRRSN